MLYIVKRKRILPMNIIPVDYSNCPIRNVISVFSDKWSILVLLSIFNSGSGVIRYNEIQKKITDCSQKMLSQTLKKLVEHHLIERHVYPVVPPKVEYTLTDLGKSLMPCINSLVGWAEDNFANVAAI